MRRDIDLPSYWSYTQPSEGPNSLVYVRGWIMAMTGAGAVDVADVANVLTLVSVEDGTKTVLVL